MELKDAYMEVAHRSIDAAEAALAANVHEAASFYSYHAFESMGGAFCVAKGHIYSKDHSRKINQFVAVTSQGGLRKKLGIQVSTLAISVASIRNKCLYPEELFGGGIETPSQYIDSKDAEKLLKRVKGILKKVNKYM